MSDFKEFFKDDPWVGMITGCYPEGRRLYRNDDRFWISINDNDQLLFFVHEKQMSNIKPLENLAGVEVYIEGNGNNAARLICMLTEFDLDSKEKFSIVAKDVAFSCSEFSGTQLFLKVQERIKSWANFLKPTRSGLTESEYIGFWGELYCVSEVLMKSYAPAEAVRFWIGPEGKKQDLTLNSIAIEVKTSISGDARTIKISSVEQLEKITESLFLMHIIANPSNNEAGLSLEELYNQCLKLIGHDLNAETLFLRKVSRLYGKSNKVQLHEKLSLVSLKMYEVREGFPCICRQDIPQSIAKLKYEIYISSLDEFEVAESINEVIEHG